MKSPFVVAGIISFLMSSSLIWAGHKMPMSSFSNAPVYTDQSAKEKVSRLISKVDEWIDKKELDPLLGTQLKMAGMVKPIVVASLVGEGFFGKCGEMPKNHRDNYFRTLVEGAKFDAPLKIAEAVRSSLQQTTGITEKGAQDKSCQLANGPCFLYYPSGPVALNCMK